MDYDEGKYHPATDIGAPEGDPVYAIADGEIVYISVNGWEENNYGIFIKHKLNTGEEFLALYGHIVPDSGDLRVAEPGPVSPAVPVKGGENFATIGHYFASPHLHFGVRPGTSLTGPGPFGKLLCPDVGPIEDLGGFADPIDWITTQTPYPPTRCMKFEDGTDRAVIQSTIPGTSFTTTEGFDWIYGDISTGNYNATTPPDATGPFVTNGNFFAWLGENQGLGRIDFTGATATAIKMLYSSSGTTYLEAYDDTDGLIDSDSGLGNTGTGTLDELSVGGADIAYVIVHDSGNQWLVDYLKIRDLLAETRVSLPSDFSVVSRTQFPWTRN